MLYNIINMSDSYTVKTDDFEVAAIACVILGRGQYAFEPLEEGGASVPIFFIGGSDEWFQEHFDRDVTETFEHVKAEKRQALIDCLDSVLIGDRTDRELFDKATSMMTEDQIEEYRKEYHEKKRSSMNNIGKRAWDYANHLRGEAPAPAPAPQQVF
jgi:hypothetical protein